MSAPSTHIISHLVFLAGLFALEMIMMMAPAALKDMPLLLPCFYGVSMCCYTLVVQRSWQAPTNGLVWTNYQFHPRRIATKYLGMFLTVGGLAALYWLFPEYLQAHYRPFFGLCVVAFPYVLPLALVYVAVIDGVMRDPDDGYAHTGRLITAYQTADKQILADHARAWLVRGFFLPIMVGILYNLMHNIAGFSVNAAHTPLELIAFIIQLTYLADITPVVVGYTLSLRILDNHIQSTDRTVLGWVVCLMCYMPFWTQGFYPSYFAYIARDWQFWFQDMPVMQVIWGGMIVILLALYASASLSFGLRWSNLTYRGTISEGVYRICKHPAYLFKNIAWWLVDMPFMVANGDLQTSLRHCVMLLGINGIYYLRAKTEEAHLMQFPDYQTYATGRTLPVSRRKIKATSKENVK